jgi:hypothetical protein
MSFSDDAKAILRAIAGTLISGGGGFFLWMYLKPPGHVIQPTIVYSLVALVGFGAILVDQDLVIGIFKKLIDLYRSFRAPPAPPAPPAAP